MASRPRLHNPLLSPTTTTVADTAPVHVSTRTQVHPSTRPPVDVPTRTPVAIPLHEGAGRSRDATIKFTFYFTPDQLDRLEQLWGAARQAGRSRGMTVNKSALMRIALERLLAEYDREPSVVLDQLLDTPR